MENDCSIFSPNYIQTFRVKKTYAKSKCSMIYRKLLLLLAHLTLASILLKKEV